MLCAQKVITISMNSDNVEHHPQNNVVYKKKILAVLATTFGRKDKFYAAT